MKNTDLWDETPSRRQDRQVSNRLDYLNLENNRQFPCDVLKQHTPIQISEAQQLDWTEPFYKINIHSVTQWIPSLVRSLNIPYIVHNTSTRNYLYRGMNFSIVKIYLVEWMKLLWIWSVSCGPQFVRTCHSEYEWQFGNSCFLRNVLIIYKITLNISVKNL
jgi:hypothetical protein